MRQLPLLKLIAFLLLISAQVISADSGEKKEEEEKKNAVSSEDHAEHQQVHLSLGSDETEMIVTWQTMHKSKHHAYVQYGREKDNLKHQAKAEVVKFKEHHTKFYTYRALMKHLKPGHSYYYHVGYEGAFSHRYHFRTLHQGHKWLPSLAVYGDMGIANDRSLPYIQRDVEKHEYDAIFHFGDFAYNLNKDDGERGNRFMRALEPIAARVPYMTCTGNHERHGNFSHYDARFSMLRRPQHHHDHDRPLSERLNNHYYSLDIGPAHIIMFSTEFYYFLEFGYEQIRHQYEWLKADLERANRKENRAKRPFIIVFGHRPFYCLKLMDCPPPVQEREELRKGLREWPPKKHHHHHHHHHHHDDDKHPHISGQPQPHPQDEHGHQHHHHHNDKHPHISGHISGGQPQHEHYEHHEHYEYHDHEEDHHEHHHHHHHHNVKREARPEQHSPPLKTFAEASEEGDHHDRYYGLEKLFYETGVDLYISGHEHYYFRTTPIYNFKWHHSDKKNDYTDPRYPIHIVSGSAGCFENHSHFNSKPEWLVKHSLDYGYMKMAFLSSHKVELKQYSVDKKQVIDHITIHKTHDYPAWLGSGQSGGKDDDDKNTTSSSSSHSIEPEVPSTEASLDFETTLAPADDDSSESTAKHPNDSNVYKEEQK